MQQQLLQMDNNIILMAYTMHIMYAVRTITQYMAYREIHTLIMR